MRAAIACSCAIAACLVVRGAAGACARPTDPGGTGGYTYGAETVRSFGTTDVLVFYVTNGPHAVNTATTRGDGVPDDVAKVAEVTSDALASYAKMGYRPPVSDATNPSCGSNGGDGRFDVYLVHMIGGDGTTVAESDRCTTAGAARQCASFVYAQANYAEIYPTSEIGIRTVLPHETFHAVQNAYDASLDRFWAEGTAQWAAKTLDPSLTDLERFLPAFFAQTSRSLDAPSNGVTASFLYGAAIWPVFLTQRHGDAIVRSILEREGEAGGPALAAADSALKLESSSLAAEVPLFAAWNAATGARAAAGGYPNAASYPVVSVADLPAGGAQGITSGLASYFFHAKVDAPVTVSLDTNASRNAGLLLPLADGKARIDGALPLPARLDGEGIVVVSGITSDKTDAPFAVSLAPIADAGADAAPPASTTGAPSSGSSGGCAVSRRGSRVRPFDLAPIVALGLLVLRRRSRAGR